MIRQILKSLQIHANCPDHAKRIARQVKAAGGERVTEVEAHEDKVTYKQLNWVNDEESEFCEE